MNTSLSILFCGDFAPCFGFEEHTLKRKGEIFGDLRKEIDKSDFSFLNIEAPLTTSRERIVKSGPHLSAHPDCVSAITDAGFNIAGLANNHIMDAGESGFRETLTTIRNAGIDTCGADLNLADAQKPLIIRKNNTTAAIIAVAEHEFSIASPTAPGAAPADTIDVSRQIESIRNDVDFVIITMHGGNEYLPYPRPGFAKKCRYFIDRGADAVICHHSHVAGAYETYRNKPIVYSLGNLIFGMPNAPEGWESGYAVRLNFATDAAPASLEVIPYTQSLPQKGLVLMQGAEKAAFLKKLEEYERIMMNESRYQSEWNNFCDQMEQDVLTNVFSPVFFRGVKQLFKFSPIRKMLLPKKVLARRLVSIRCESHREVLLNIMERRN